MAIVATLPGEEDDVAQSTRDRHVLGSVNTQQATKLDVEQLNAATPRGRKGDAMENGKCDGESYEISEAAQKAIEVRKSVNYLAAG